jgi:hypothetical protein
MPKPSHDSFGIGKVVPVLLVFFVWSQGVFANRLSPTKKSPKMQGATFATPSRKENL